MYPHTSQHPIDYCHIPNLFGRPKPYKPRSTRLLSKLCQIRFVVRPCYATTPIHVTNSQRVLCNSRTILLIAYTILAFLVNQISIDVVRCQFFPTSKTGMLVAWSASPSLGHPFKYGPARLLVVCYLHPVYLSARYRLALAGGTLSPLSARPRWRLGWCIGTPLEERDGSHVPACWCSL